MLMVFLLVFAHILNEFLFYLTSFQVYYYFVLFYNCIISVYLVYVSYQKNFTYIFTIGEIKSTLCFCNFAYSVLSYTT